MSRAKGIALLVLGLATGVFVHAAVLSGTHGSRVFDPWLVLAIAFAVRARRTDALLVAALVGLTQDLTSSMVLGVHVVSKVTAAYLATLGANRLVPGQPLTAAVLIGGATIVEEIVVLASGVVLGQSFNSRTPFELGIAVLLNVVVGIAAFALLDRSRAKRPHMTHARR